MFLAESKRARHLFTTLAGQAAGKRIAEERVSAFRLAGAINSGEQRRIGNVSDQSHPLNCNSSSAKDKERSMTGIPVCPFSRKNGQTGMSILPLLQLFCPKRFALSRMGRKWRNLPAAPA